jgi:hypothetical protein
MRYIIAVLATWLVVTASPTDLKAQGRGTGPVVTDSLIDSYVSRLNLDSEQEASLRSVLQTQSEKTREMMGAARAGGREAMEAMRPRLQELQEETNKQVEELLTEDQIPEYHKIQAEIQERRRSMRRQRAPQ